MEEISIYSGGMILIRMQNNCIIQAFVEENRFQGPGILININAGGNFCSFGHEHNPNLSQVKLKRNKSSLETYKTRFHPRSLLFGLWRRTKNELTINNLVIHAGSSQ
jgi:hypothetical protein